MNEFQKSEKYQKAFAGLPEEWQPVSEQLVADYSWQTVKLFGKGYVAYDVLAALDEEKHTERQNLGRLRRGIRTREESYYRPILQALVDMGGSGRMREVLDKVEKIMKDTLKPVDFEPLASDPVIPAGGMRPSGRGIRWSTKVF